MTVRQIQAGSAHASSSAFPGGQAEAPEMRSAVPELLPWADPYIADLHRQHADDMQREEIAGQPARLNGRARVSHAPRRSRGESHRPERMTRSRTASARGW
jgi:hypothetical protein